MLRLDNIHRMTEMAVCYDYIIYTE